MGFQQKQIMVPPETATFLDLGHGKHFGQIPCPFCGSQAIIAGPYKGVGAMWVHQSCGHSQGIAAGAGLDITVIFRAHHTELESEAI